jgi:hypothetical protein
LVNGFWWLRNRGGQTKCSDFVPTRKVAVSSSAMAVLPPFGKLSPTTRIAIEIRLDLRVLTPATYRFDETEDTSTSKMGDNDAKPSGEELEKQPPFPLTEVDKWVLSQTDEEFHLHDWDELRNIVGR